MPRTWAGRQATLVADEAVSAITFNDGGTAMSVRKLTKGLLAALAVTVVPTIQATVPGLGVAHAAEPTLPGVDPFAFDPDFHWFEPVHSADYLDMRPEKRHATGWYATYDKLQLYGNRPDIDGATSGVSTVSLEHELDEGGGHRYEFGFVNPNDGGGWQFNYTTLDVHEDDQVTVRRSNILNEDIFNDGPDFAVPPLGFNALPETGNDIGFFNRSINVGPVLQDVSMDSFEFNKTWRMIPFHYGGLLEPLSGFRYIRLRDTNAFQGVVFGTTSADVPTTVTTTTFDPTTGIVVVSESIVLVTSDFNNETVTSRANDTYNDILSGQFGFRYSKFINRMRLSTELRVMVGMSLQNSNSKLRSVTTSYDGDDQNAAVINVQVAQDREYFDGEEFFAGFDLRSEVGFQLSKSIHIRGGFQLVDLATGIWRGGQSNAISGLNGGDRDQNFLAFGGTFGIELNR